MNTNSSHCTEFTEHDGHFLDTWAALNNRRNQQTLSQVICFTEDGHTLHEFAEFAARYWHPALSNYLETATAEELAEVVGASGLATKTTRLIHIAATHHQYELVEELVAAIVSIRYGAPPSSLTSQARHSNAAIV